MSERILTVDQSSSRRVAYYDWMKLTAAFLVVFYHFSYYDLDYGFVPGQFYLPNGIRIMMSFAAASVPLFFLVNGALTFRRHRSWRESLGKAVKILILMGIWYVARFPSWFFRTLVILYLMFPVLQWLREHHRRLFVALCGGVFLMPFCYNLALMCLKGVSLVARVDDLSGGRSVTGMFTMYSILYFCLGSWLDRAKPWRMPAALGCTAAGWILVLTECTIYTNLQQQMWDGVNTAFPTVGALLMAVGLFMVFRNIPASFGQVFLGWCCESILAIYVLHMTMVRLLKHFFQLTDYGIVTAVAATGVVCLMCILVHKLCKRIPVVNQLFRI